MSPLRDFRHFFLPMRDPPLEYSRERWRSIFLKQVVARGADVNQPLGGGEYPDSTPLLVAARHSSLEAIDTLLDLGADPRIRDHQGRNAVMIAIMQRHRTYPDEEEPQPGEIYPLTSSLCRIPPGQLTSIIDRPLAAGIPINEQDKEGMTAPHFFF